MPGRIERRSRAVRGFTLIEIMVVTLIIAVIGALTLPYLARTQGDRAEAGAALLQSDLRFARIATMANPQDPVIVRFRSDGTGYWLARASAPTVPITRPDTGASWNITMGQDRAASSSNVTLTLTNIAGATLQFTPLGTVSLPAGTPKIKFTGTGPGAAAWCEVLVDPVSGTPTLAWSS